MSDKILKEARLRGDTVHLDLWYPGIEDNARYVSVGLMHVRAADNIRISYDFGRDGWKIEQASRFAWVDNVRDPDWAEVAFVQAWARQETEEETEKRLGFKI